MVETRLRARLGEGLMIAKRLRTLKHRAARWFLPPVRFQHEGHQQRAQDSQEPSAARYASRGVKPPVPLQ